MKILMKIKRFKYILLVLVALFAVRFVYKFSPRRVEFLGQYSKVWAHRVNSTEKLLAAIEYFEGMELDLVYFPKSKTLDVGHPPTPSIGLTFENYLGAIPNDSKPFLWLDIKNLTTKNALEILDRLSFLLKEKHYPVEKILIESQHPEALQIFIEQGFQTSYYLPFGLSEKSSFEIDKTIESIKLGLSNNPKMGVSSNYLDYEIVSKYFPERQKYLWKIDGLTFNNYSQTRKILKDTTVKVVLSKFRSFKGNR